VKFKGISTAMVALSLVTVPTLAVAAPVATPLTRPAAEKVDGDNQVVGGGVIVGVLALAAVGAGIAVVASDNDDKPNSP
jgi:hypothetical protein